MSEISFIAKMAEIILRFTKPKYMDSQIEIETFLANKSKAQDKAAKSIFKSVELNGMQTFTFGNRKNCKNIMLYIHGGAYVNEINYQHHLYCMKLSRKLDSYVLAPVYGLAPNHNLQETFEAVESLYRDLLKFDKNIILMGDSAGGGFVLSFAQYLKTVNLSQPKSIIVFSPWTDVSMGNPPYDSENDPILGEIGLKEIGKSWAGNLNAKDYRVSPLYGDKSDLAKTLIFAGEKEIFYKDIKKYVEDCKNARLVTGKGLFHIYPLFPIPEAKKAFKEIEKEIML
ncbi:alpha/beta hydrolase fold domain-containing protein [Methanobrevibacter sp.]|uniref:alpha/beta hydrolase fold domain-containing protein n=1 Tax=Methanobrevibacter sp. TaxID=66852 RepID=UPI0025F437B9|nr:alpha/beta hydrolase [Methanobrevibacter sp.]MBR4447572.1 alpha/beta hydrolase [Methanobrevibacter sp.]